MLNLTMKVRSRGRCRGEARTEIGNLAEPVFAHIFEIKVGVIFFSPPAFRPCAGRTLDGDAGSARPRLRAPSGDSQRAWVCEVSHSERRVVLRWNALP
jgi:hypothetical protein